MKMAHFDSPVLILGESGTGKELLAEYIHANSSQSAGPLVRVNCAAIPSELIESELFGHTQGAFTDASRDKSGYFDRADGGSIFLDEVAELTSSVQAKLLRVLQDGCFQPVGGDIPVDVNVRVIAATNKNLLEAMRESKFREDLYYRLAVLILEVPPLRERPEDIEALARHFLMLHHEKGPDSPSDISIEALDTLLTYQWPGNVRELQNVIERAIVAAQGRALIAPGDLSIGSKENGDSDYSGKTLKDSINLFKKNLIREVLKNHGGNQTLTARSLGIQRTYLSRMLKELSIKTEKENEDDK